MSADRNLIGKRVRLVRCNDPYTRLVPGDLGTVWRATDDASTVFVKWDSGSTSGLIREAGDEWEVIEMRQEVIEMQHQIAKIRRATFGVNDHGVLACRIDLDYGRGDERQDVAGYVLDRPVRDNDGKFLGRQGTAFGLEFLAAVMRAVGVNWWEQVEGRTVLALLDRDSGSKVVGLAPLPTEPGEEFIFESLVAKYSEKGERLPAT